MVKKQNKNIRDSVTSILVVLPDGQTVEKVHEDHHNQEDKGQEEGVGEGRQRALQVDGDVAAQNKDDYKCRRCNAITISLPKVQVSDEHRCRLHNGEPGLSGPCAKCQSGRGTNDRMAVAPSRRCRIPRRRNQGQRPPPWNTPTEATPCLSPPCAPSLTRRPRRMM